MEPGEGDEIDSKLSQIRVKLAWESQAACDSRHGSRNQMVQITNCSDKMEATNIRLQNLLTKYKLRKIQNHTAWSGELKCTEADIIESFIIEDHAFICIFNKLMDRKSRIIRLNDCIRDLRRWENRESKHHSIWEFLSDFGDQKSTHARPGSSS